MQYEKFGRFVMSQTVVPFDSPPAFGETSTATLRTPCAAGKMLTRLELEVTMTRGPSTYPGARAAYYPVEALCKRVQLQVGPHVLDDLDSDYLRQFDSWHRNSQEKAAYGREANFDPAARHEHSETLRLPLPFGFTRDVALGLPVCMMTEPVRVTLELADAAVVGVREDGLSVELFAEFVTWDDAQSWLEKSPAPQLLLPTVQKHVCGVKAAREDGLVSNVMRLPFRGPVRNVIWMLKETRRPPADRTFHARYVGDPDGPQLTCEDVAPLYSRAPLYDAALSYNNKATLVHRKGSYFARGRAAGVSETPGSYFYSLAMQPSGLNPEGYVDLTEDLNLWLHLRTRRSVRTDAARESEARDISGLKQLRVYAEGFQLVTLEEGRLVLPWTLSEAFEAQA